MDFRTLGRSGLNVPVIGLGTALFRPAGAEVKGVDQKLAASMIDLAIECEAAFFDTGDIYGGSEEVLGALLGARRRQVLISTKVGLRSGPGVNETGASRQHLIEACERSLRCLNTDYIDLWQIHSFDARTPVEETMRALDDLVRAGKVRYVGCSNYAGWQLMKSLAASDRHGWARFVAHQVSYSLIGRELEWDLIPLGLDQDVASLVWSPLANGLLSGKFGRNGAALDAQTGGAAARTMPRDQLLAVLERLHDVAEEVGKPPSQVALNWLMQRPTVATIFVGASTLDQLRGNLDAVSFRLTLEQIARLDEVSAKTPVYPYWHQRGVGSERNPPPPAIRDANVRVDQKLMVPRKAD